MKVPHVRQVTLRLSQIPQGWASKLVGKGEGPGRRAEFLIWYAFNLEPETLRRVPEAIKRLELEIGVAEVMFWGAELALTRY